MIPVTYIVPGESSNPRFGAAFAAGCRGRINRILCIEPGPVAMFATPPTWPILRQAMAEGRDWYYGDHGYFGRGTYFRVTKNRYQHDGLGRARQNRFKQFGHQIRPWQTGGRHVVLCPNSPVYHQFHGMPADQWIAKVTAELRAATDREIRVRWKTTERPLAEDLVGAWAVVVYSSASAIFALMAGVPVITLAPWAATARMGRTSAADIERPLFPEDREAFVNVLASNQWTLDEMTRGDAWRWLRAEERHRAA